MLIGTQCNASTNNPVGVAYNSVANHKLASKCIKVKVLGSSVCIHQLG